ncbi:MAG: phosphoribosylformimino-5-aminoimidazole carboxamide ribotide isomerase [Lachnospiraceae bacterium]|jgi:phosphoribosylformimino-5-aminoimidazole carboxamide ribotide isomerase|nr:phosphoribosylformimino-5-aminoimidazole carboxamide ribotide isomerase [Lachnospiraceae bacterium]
MRFRPCIDIHDGRVKQIIGSSLREATDGSTVRENFIADHDAAYYAKLYRQLSLAGGHVIILNRGDSEFYEASLSEAMAALAVYPKGLQIGGGVNSENAATFIAAGASHVIATSYVFRDGEIDFHRLQKLVDSVGREKVVLDLSCRTSNGRYFVVTDRWQRFTTVEVNTKTLNELAAYCDEFLIHGVDVEGKSAGIDEDLLTILSEYISQTPHAIPLTYAGGIHTIADIERIRERGRSRIDITIGSSLDIFGGQLPLAAVLEALSPAL